MLIDGKKILVDESHPGIDSRKHWGKSKSASILGNTYALLTASFFFITLLLAWPKR